MLHNADEKVSKMNEMFLGLSDMEIMVFPYNDGGKITKNLSFLHIIMYNISLEHKKFKISTLITCN